MYWRLINRYEKIKTNLPLLRFVAGAKGSLLHALLGLPGFRHRGATDDHHGLVGIARRTFTTLAQTPVRFSIGLGQGSRHVLSPC